MIGSDQQDDFTPKLRPDGYFEAHMQTAERPFAFTDIICCTGVGEVNATYPDGRIGARPVIFGMSKTHLQLHFNGNNVNVTWAQVASALGLV